jgi:hypothetical protein
MVIQHKPLTDVMQCGTRLIKFYAKHPSQTPRSLACFWCEVHLLVVQVGCLAVDTVAVGCACSMQFALPPVVQSIDPCCCTCLGGSVSQARVSSTHTY